MTKQKIQVGDLVRTYLQVSPAAPKTSAPLLMALHGTSQRGKTLQRFSGRTLDALGDRVGAELAYLDGVGRAWNDAQRRHTSTAQKKNVDDVGFVEAVVERFDRPVVAVGYSNGGQLLHRLLREKPGLVAGAVFIGAGLPVDDDFTLVEVEPDRVPTLLLHGTADPIVPYEGGATKLLGRTRGRVKSARQTADSYAPDASPVVTRVGDVQRTDWPGVRQVTQLGTGHVVPNRTTSPNRLFVGPSHADLDLGEEMQEFFGL
jgi:polyhydroxybutyrate depolymerase